MNIITAVYNFLWGDLITLPLPGGSSVGLSLLVLLLVRPGSILRSAPGLS